MVVKEQAQKFLAAKFPARHVEALLQHFFRATNHFRKGEWEDCIGRAGKFVEAALKALSVAAGKTPASGRVFKADTVINELGQVPKGTVDDTIRIVIPRACRFVYEIASNRGGRHDPEEIDPNEMDATVALTNCSWVVAEMIRFAQKGVVDLAAAKKIVESLVEKKYPLIENVDGRLYFHRRKKTGPEMAILALAYSYPGRVEKRDLIDTVERNGFTAANARMAVRSVMKFVDNDGSDRLKLLAPGLEKAEQIMRQESS